MHEVDPVSEVEPDGQAVQLVAPYMSEYVFAAQNVQVVLEPVDEYSPGLHCAHEHVVHDATTRVSINSFRR